jgi:hypothetical protein
MSNISNPDTVNETFKECKYCVHKPLNFNNVDKILEESVKNTIDKISNQNTTDKKSKEFNTPIYAPTNPGSFVNFQTSVFNIAFVSNVPTDVTISIKDDIKIATITPKPGCYVKGIIQITQTCDATVIPAIYKNVIITKTPKYSCIVRKYFEKDVEIYELKFY